MPFRNGVQLMMWQTSLDFILVYVNPEANTRIRINRIYHQTWAISVGINKSILQ